MKRKALLIDLHATSVLSFSNVNEKSVLQSLNKKRLLLRCIQHFKSDLFIDMDHMCISGTEPSSVILSQIK